MRLLLPLGLLLVVCLQTIKADYEDIRCMCICPPLSIFTGNSSIIDKKVYRLPNLTPDNCKCEFVLAEQANVTSLTPRELTEFCLRCQCKYESRSTTTIKVVVIFIVCVVAMLFIYMLFLLILDPLMNKSRVEYTTQRDEDVAVDDMASDRDTESLGVRPRSRNVMQRVRSEQEKWKGTVETQRKHIFDRHTMLN